MEIDNSKENLAIAYASVMIQYFYLVKVVLEENISQGNNWAVIFDNEPLDWKEYEKRTKWSDFHLILPVLFSLYHGVELAMKALLVVNENRAGGHKLSEIYPLVLNINDMPSMITFLLSKYIDKEKMPENLSNFIKLNNKSIDDYYDFLKYPTDIDFKTINNYWPIKYREGKSIAIFKEIVTDIQSLSKEVQLYIKARCPNMN